VRLVKPHPYAGLGLSFETDSNGRSVRVGELDPGGLAAKSGLLVSDMLMAIDGWSTAFTSPDEAARQLRAASGHVRTHPWPVRWSLPTRCTFSRQLTLVPLAQVDVVVQRGNLNLNVDTEAPPRQHANKAPFQARRSLFALRRRSDRNQRYLNKITTSINLGQLL